MRTSKNFLYLFVTVAALMLAQTTVLAQGVISGPEITAFPDGDATSGKFVNLTTGLRTLGEAGTNLCIETPSGKTEFLLQIFDGDYGGLWDLKKTGPRPVVQYRLYADPAASGAMTNLVEEWTSTNMVDNGWYTCTSDNSSTGNATSSTAKVVNVAGALDTTDNLPVYRYNLVVTWAVTPFDDALNSFKCRAEGEVFGLKLSRYGFSAFKWGAFRYGYTHPVNGGDEPWDFDYSTFTFSNIQPPTTTYDGTWQFRLEIPAATDSIELWNGDFDLQVDVGDDNSPDYPAWLWQPGDPLPVDVSAEGQQSPQGLPPDDYVRAGLTAPAPNGTLFYYLHPYAIPSPYSGSFSVTTGLQSGPGIIQKISDEDRTFTIVDMNPSGNLEWEVFRVAAAGSSSNPDATVSGVSSLPAGSYFWEIEGVDAQNTLFLRSNFNLRSQPGSYSLGDRVWLDQDSSGGADDLSEPGINGVIINLYMKINGVWEPYASAVTGPIPDPNNTGQFIDGYYLFEGLARGEYKVEVVTSTLPAGVAPTYDYDGTSTPNVVELTADYTLLADNLAVDFSYASSGAIGDYVWKDLDEDGVQDTNEDGIPGVTVELWGDLNGTGTLVLLETTTTSSTGKYLFNGLTAGLYEVRVDSSTLPVGVRAPTWDYDDQTSFPSIVTPHVTQLTLAEKEVNLDVDFGYTEGDNPNVVTGIIGDFVWQDSDEDGIWDVLAGELPLTGVIVQLTGDWDGDGVEDTLYRTTDGDGYYLFTGLAMGSYTVTVISSNFDSGKPLYRMLQTYDYDLTLDDKTSVTLVKDALEHFLLADFGYRPKCVPGTGTPGYWKNHPNAWPVETIVIGGVEYTKDEAIYLMGQPEKKDKTFTVFRHLVSAKLNVGVGNDFSCVEDEILAADAWMKIHAFGTGHVKVAGDSDAWAEIQDAATQLDKYNNGKLPCAPSRDDVTCDCTKTTKTTKATKSGKRGKGGVERRKRK